MKNQGLNAPSTTVFNYVVLIESKIMTLDEVPELLQEEVAKWLSFFVNGKLPKEVPERVEND